MNQLIFRITYLTGRAVATAYNARESAEWPPHPARVYSALVAAWAEAESPDGGERAALEWLATLAPPRIAAGEAWARAVVPHFVPVNDAGVLRSYASVGEKLESLEQELAEARRQWASAQAKGAKGEIAKAEKAVAKLEKSIEKQQHQRSAQLLADQEPDPKPSASAIKAALALFPEQRVKQPRSFPSVGLGTPRASLIWAASPGELARHRPSIAALASRIARIGHSSSLVTCCLVDEPQDEIEGQILYEPSAEAGDVLRVPGPDQLERLIAAHAVHGEIEPRVLPCRFQRYRRADRGDQGAVHLSVFGDDWLVFRQIGGRKLSLTLGTDVARAMRGALMSHAKNPPPELLSGHKPTGEPLDIPHLAIVPLPFVGHEHATGDLLGLALVFPRGADAAQRQAVLQAIGLWEASLRSDGEDQELAETPPLKLVLGRSGEMLIERIEWGEASLKTLRPETWCWASRSWVTATPIALDRNPGNLYARDSKEAEAAYSKAQESIAAACEHIGLPRPTRVQVHPSVPLHGAAKARAYPSFPPDPKKHQRVKVHARLEFDDRIRGPLLIGAGRYFGLGLLWPLRHED